MSLYFGPHAQKKNTFTSIQFNPPTSCHSHKAEMFSVYMYIWYFVLIWCHGTPHLVLLPHQHSQMPKYNLSTLLHLPRINACEYSKSYIFMVPYKYLHFNCVKICGAIR